MQQPGRSYSTDKYRYSINGQEKSPEIAPNTTTALFWEYDARIARRWNVDPKPSVSISPYNCFTGNPILFSDPLGDTTQPNFSFRGRYSWQPSMIPGSSNKAIQTASTQLAGVAPLLAINSSSGLRAIPGGLSTTGASTGLSWSSAARLGTRFLGVVGFVFMPNTGGGNNGYIPRPDEMAKPYIPIAGVIGAPFSLYIPRPGAQPYAVPISPVMSPGKDPSGNPLSLIYETERSKKYGEKLGYFGITQLAFTGPGGGGSYRYGALREETINLQGFIGVAPRNVALGVEQNLLELNNNGRPYPKLSNRIDNYNNAIDPGSMEYQVNKTLGQIFLNLWWPDWRTRFLKPTIDERRTGQK